MEAIKTKGIAHEGILSVPVPKEFEERELEVIVLFSNEKKSEEGDEKKVVAKEEKVEKFYELPVQERLRILEQYTGTAKYPNFPINKYDVYDQ